MVSRFAKLSKTHSFFLIGPRGSGKSTLIRQLFSPDYPHVKWIDLLSPREEDKYRVNPNALYEECLAHPQLKTVVIDEVQKLPKLLDIVHQLIEQKKIQFVLTGSSARKLKRGAANLLAGRAFFYQLYPFSANELGDAFDLNEALSFGLLPKVQEFLSRDDKKRFLDAYTLTYLKEEIQVEQVVRNLDPFRKFLEVSAQMNTKIINYSKIARDVGVDANTVKSYFQILEDTLLGTLLEPYHTSVRKRQTQSPKFYFFDTGVVRSLNRSLRIPVNEGTYEYGALFENFIFTEMIKRNEYMDKDFRFYYLTTKDGAEIDFIIDEPGGRKICIEVKSKSQVNKDDVKPLARLSADIENSQPYCLSNDPNRKIIDGVTCVHWQDGLGEIF